MVIRDQKQNLEEKLDAVINDPVNHPSHYTSSKIEVIEYILDHGFDYLLGNVVKYISRAGLKSKDTEIQDLDVKTVRILRCFYVSFTFAPLFNSCSIIKSISSMLIF